MATNRLDRVRSTESFPDSPGASAFAAAAAHARASDALNYREIASNHMVPSNQPAELTEILVGCL